MPASDTVADLSLPSSALTSRLDFAAVLDQHGRLLQLQCALPDLALIPERLVLREAVSQPFELTLDCVSTGAHFELKALVGEQLTVSLLQPDGRYAPWHGYVFDAAQLGSDGGLSRYRLVMRPWLAFLGLRRDSFVYQDLSAQAIIEDVFADHPSAHFAFELSAPLRPRSLCIQYDETDLDFVTRLLAEEGLSYRFEHLGGDAAAAADQAAQARHRLLITDHPTPAEARPDLGPLRFTTTHPTAVVAGQRDSITAFAAQRSVQPNAVARGSWNYKHLAGSSAQATTALPIGELPTLEHYDGTGAYRYADSAAAQRAADLALSAFELEIKRLEGQGSVRAMATGSRFTLIDHPQYGANTTAFDNPGALSASHQRPDNSFVLLAVEHHAANNLGAQAAQLLQASDIERGSYKNHFHAAPAAAAIVPRLIPKPPAAGLHTALVVGIDNEALSTERDLRVKIQFPWQRGQRPAYGGLSHDPSFPDATGNAPGNERSGTWVRIAAPSAGANWGTAFTPRIGTEVAVLFLDGDIDRPMILGQLHNGQDTPPFSAGVDAGVNHPGTIAGIHSRGIDGAGYNQWVLDDAAGQLRMRLLASYSVAEVGLGHLIQQGASGAQRGAWRGSGFEVNTQGWSSLRAGQGLLVSTSARQGSYGSAQSTQMDAAEAVAQLKGARDLGQRLHDAATAAGAQGLLSHQADEAIDKFAAAIDPKRDGKHPGPVNGQEALKPGADGRTAGTEPVEAFSQPLVLLDTPSAVAMATEASLMAFAGQHSSLTAQSDLHHTAAHTYASVSGQTTSVYTHSGGLKAYAASGPVSIRAHTDALQIWADQAVTITSVNDEIRILAKDKIELVGGQARLTLDGENITFSCPGKFDVQSSTHAFLPGEVGTAALPFLPVGILAAAGPFVGGYLMHKSDERPFEGYGYRILDGDKILLQGKTSAKGETSSVTTEHARFITAQKTIMREDQRITENWSGYLDGTLTQAKAPGNDPIPEDYVTSLEGLD